MLNFSRTTGCRTTSVSVVVAPISSPPSASRIPLSSLTWLKSTTTFGLLMRSFSQSKVSKPPAMTQASPRYWPSNRNVSSIVAGWKSSNASITSCITAISLLLLFRSSEFDRAQGRNLNVRRQRLLHRPAGFQRGQNRVCVHRRAPEDFVAECIQQGVQDRRAAAADRGLADPARANRRFRIRNADRRPLHLLRYI